MRYPSYEIANKAWAWAFPDVECPDPFDEDDSIQGCWAGITWWLDIIETANKHHPIKKKYRTRNKWVQAFFIKYTPEEDEGLEMMRKFLETTR